MSDETGLEAYLAALARALVLYPGRRADVLDEVRDHLLEARERGVREGASPDEAERAALAAFGAPASLARGFLAQQSRARARVLLPLALVLGLVLAYVDGQPTWDDTGISACAVLALAGCIGLFDPTRPWLWAAAVGGWFPLLAILEQRSLGAALALVFALAGAWGARFARRLVAS